MRTVGIKVLPPDVPGYGLCWTIKVTLGLSQVLYIEICYLPLSMSSCAWLSDLHWPLLEAEIEQYKSLGEVMIVGDLNVRLG